jgi:hypothetical protein
MAHLYLTLLLMRATLQTMLDYPTIEQNEEPATSGTHPLKGERLVKTSLNLTSLNRKATLREKLGTSGCAASPDLYGEWLNIPIGLRKCYSRQTSC